jgi:hypothetical protein
MSNEDSEIARTSPLSEIRASVFADLEALRLSPDSAAVGGTREILVQVPVRKPTRTEFFRVHADPQMSLTTAVFIDKQERDGAFFVMPEMREALLGEIKPALLLTAITTQGVVMIWPIVLPSDGRRSYWFETAREAAELAKQNWIRMPADMSRGGYRIFKAEGELAAPTWPDKSLNDLLEIAFRDRIIDREDHPVVRRLRGLI